MTTQANTGRVLTTLVTVLTLGAVAKASEARKPREELAQAHQVLTASGVKGGLIVHVGCGDGRLTAALGTGNSYLVHGLDGDAQKIAEARDHIRGLGIYGRVSVEQCNARRLPYAEGLVNLVVSENLGEVPMDEVVRVLCPRGVAYIKQHGQ